MNPHSREYLSFNVGYPNAMTGRSAAPGIR